MAHVYEAAVKAVHLYKMLFAVRAQDGDSAPKVLHKIQEQRFAVIRVHVGMCASFGENVDLPARLRE